eukprot:gene32468-17869_t
MEGALAANRRTSHSSASTSAGSWLPVDLDASQVYVLGRPFNEWGGGIFNNVSPEMREAVLNLGLCHYMVAIKRPCGTVLQYDFGPQGGRDVGTSRSKSGLPAEVRETRLPGGIPTNVHALYVGKTMMDLDHIREFNSLQPKYYALYKSDCRHYANGLVQLLTGTERSTAQYLRHRYIERMAAGDPQGAWHQGLYNVAHLLLDWATAAVAAVPLGVAGRNALATGICLEHGVVNTQDRLWELAGSAIRICQTLGTVAGNRIAGVFARFMPRTERLQAVDSPESFAQRPRLTLTAPGSGFYGAKLSQTIPTTSRALTLASPQSQLVSTNSLFSSLRNWGLKKR